MPMWHSTHGTWECAEILVRRVLRVHHMARLPAELRRIHVCRAAIARHRNHQQVHDRRQQNDVDAMTKHAVIEIDLGKRGRNFSGFPQYAAPQVDADRNQRQAER